jgi:cation diffusion facilitator CzcD-associated flavoprotein CzcO
MDGLFTDRSNDMTDLPRVCVIGAGLSGLTACKALSDRAIPYTCFESGDDVGGNWYFGNTNGRSAAYKSLHINTSKRSASFKDLPMPDRYPDYPHHTQIKEYLQEYSHTFGLRQNIRFNATVQHCSRLEGGGWEVELEGGDVERFDALLVANGHHWDPSFPDPAFPGVFDGDVLHAHQYVDPTDPLDMRDKRVLVVGMGNSGADIVSELSRRGLAKSVILSSRGGGWVLPKYLFGKPTDQLAATIPWLSLRLQRRIAQIVPKIASGRMEDYGLPKPDHKFLESQPTASSELLVRLGSGDASAKPNVAELMGDHVRFVDGTVEPIDTIVYATGYKVSFPFFSEDFISAPRNVLPLYKRMFKPGIDDLAFIGLAQAIPTLFPFAEAQSKFAATWLAGEWALPTVQAMEREMRADEARFTKHYTQRPRHTMQHDYVVYDYELRRKIIPAGRRRAAQGGAVRLAGRAGAGQTVTAAGRGATPVRAALELA